MLFHTQFDLLRLVDALLGIFEPTGIELHIQFGEFEDLTIGFSALRETMGFYRVFSTYVINNIVVPVEDFELHIIDGADRSHLSFGTNIYCFSNIIST
jgi:hypothetical protein